MLKNKNFSFKYTFEKCIYVSSFSFYENLGLFWINFIDKYNLLAFFRQKMQQEIVCLAKNAAFVR